MKINGMTYEELLEKAASQVEISDPNKKNTVSWENHLYGNESVLKKYLKREKKNLSWVIEHSIILNPIFVFNYKQSTPVITQSYYRNKILKAYGIRTFGTTCIYKYALNLYLKHDQINEEFGKILIFPNHSTHVHDEDDERDEVIFTKISKVLEIENINKCDVSVCMYWRDILNGRVNKWLEKGYKIYTAGSAYSQDFYLKLAELITRHEKIITVGLSSSTIYALITNKPVLNINFNTKPINDEYIMFIETARSIRGNWMR
jgi:hypothetical protein